MVRCSLRWDIGFCVVTKEASVDSEDWCFMFDCSAKLVREFKAGSADCDDLLRL